MARDLDVRHKTALVLMHKSREAMAPETHNTKLSGKVEVNGAAFRGHMRPASTRENRIGCEKAARIVGAICDAIGELLASFSAQECANHVRAAGYASS